MKKVSVIFIIAAIGFTSCSKSFLDVNDTPNNPLQVPPSAILPNTTIGMAFANGNDLNRATSVIVQHIAGVANQAATYDVYNLDGFGSYPKWIVLFLCQNVRFFVPPH